MNYYNPYFYNIPQVTQGISRMGLFSRLFGGSGITFGRIINGTQRALSFANQAIPFVKQVKPMIGNAKTMFKVMNEFKRSENKKNNKSYDSSTSKVSNYNSNNIVEKNYSNEDGPTFFV